jgi:hypothetical protein
LNELCNGGLCLHYAPERRRLEARAPFTVDGFTDAAMAAEGLYPGNTVMRRGFRDVVAERFGSGPA